MNRPRFRPAFQDAHKPARRRSRSFVLLSRRLRCLADGLAPANRIMRPPGSRSGFTLVEIMIVVALIGLLAAIAVPSWHRAREGAQFSSIGNNLRLIEGAKQQWALENKKAAADVVATPELTEYLRHHRFPNPVVGETYVVGTVEDLVVADTTAVLLGKPGPFTVTNF